MYYPSLKEDNNSRSTVDTWLGYNHTRKISSGEFYDMENLSTDQYPLLSPRKARTLLTNYEWEENESNMRGIVQAGDDVYVLWNQYLWNLSTDIKTDLSDVLKEEDHTTRQTLLVMGAYLLIFPAGVYVNLNDKEDTGRMESSYKAPEGIKISYTPCSYGGADLQNLKAADDAPENAAHGDYWICTNPDKSGLYYYNGYASSWEAVATCYIRIGIPGADLAECFNEGDAVFLNTKVDDINSGSVIQKIAKDYIVVIGFMDSPSDEELTSDAWTLTIERKLPTLDYVCTDKNRVWGCHYGYDKQSKSIVNEIYASKLGDFKNWYVYQGLSTDSYALTVGDVGEFTGCISYQGYPYFFKENVLYKIYGSYPAEYQLIQTTCHGVQKGSERSLAIVGEYLLYKGVSDVCVFDGSTPVSISKPLSRDEMYYDAVGGSCQNKYYLVMGNEYGSRRMFVYDVQYGIWEKEGTLAIEGFTKTLEGQLYAITKEDVYGLGTKNNAVYTGENTLDEEWVKWYGESGEMGFESPDKKYVSRITIRAYVPTRSEITVEISNDDRPYDVVGTIRGNDDIRSQTLAFAPLRCDHFKIRFSGHGECAVYTMAVTTELGSEE